MSKTTFTDQEAALITSEYFHKRVAELTKSLRELRERELAKAIIPPHKHNTGTTSSSGIEDVPPGKTNPPGKMDAMKGEKSAHPAEETSGEISPDDLKKEDLCKECGKGHGMEKTCMGKAMLRDSKGKVKDNGIHPESVLPEDSKATEINKPTASDAGSGGVIKKSLADIRKAATPPTAKPPSGKNMGTGVPTSAPATPKMPMAKEDLEKVGLPADGGMKAHMSAAASMAARPVAPAPKVQLPSAAQHADRASQFADFTPSAAATGHMMGAKKPGIFGRLGKSENLAKGTSVTQPIPKLKPAAAGMHTVGGTTAGLTSVTNTVASPDKTSVLPKPAAPAMPAPAAAASRNVLGKPNPNASPVLVPRPKVKLPGAHLATAGASKEGTDGDKTQVTNTAGARPANVKPAAPLDETKPHIKPKL